jgi:phage terminase small subunit
MTGNASSRRLTEKQALFAEEYALDFNATRAAERAGYSKHTARQMGAENLTKPDIRKAVADYLERRSTELAAVVDDLTETLVRYVTADISEVFDENGVPKPIAEMPEVFRKGLIKSMKIRVVESGNRNDIRVYSIVFADRTQLIKELGRRYGKWK